jgi:hypothetical protein
MSLLGPVFCDDLKWRSCNIERTGSVGGAEARIFCACTRLVGASLLRGTARDDRTREVVAAHEVVAKVVAAMLMMLGSPTAAENVPRVLSRTRTLGGSPACPKPSKSPRLYCRSRVS